MILGFIELPFTAKEAKVLSDKDFQEFMIKHMTSLSEEVKELRQSQARMEFKFTEKIDALFDGYQAINEKLDDHTERLQRIEDKPGIG